MGRKTRISFDLRKNMLKNIATAQKAFIQDSTDYIVPDLIDLFGDNWKEIRK